MSHQVPPDVFLLLTCEHGGNQVPVGYKRLFAPHAELLATHRGWDPGTRHVGEVWSQRLGTPLHLAVVTRLLVDLNRSEHHRRIFSDISRVLPVEEREHIKAEYYRPHRNAIQAAAEQAIARGQRVVHIGLHSFTPVLDGVVRKAEVSFLYDPSRCSERQLCRFWQQAVVGRSPELKLVCSGDFRVRLNYPYRGNSDGLTTSLRQLFTDEQYAGIEIEFNQQLVDRRGRIPPKLATAVLETLTRSLAEGW